MKRVELNMKNNIKRLGFSLAELLITIGIVGALSIMLLPMLKNNYDAHVTEARTRTSYNSIMQAVSLSKNAGTATKDINAEVWFNRYIKGGIQIAMNCGNTDKCWHKITTLNNENCSINGFADSVYSFKLTNGTSILIAEISSLYSTAYFGVDNETSNTIALFFDINGDDLPNIIGQDVYILVWKNKELVPSGNSKSTSDVEKNCSLSNNGYFCLQYMIDNSWKVNKEIFE